MSAMKYAMLRARRVSLLILFDHSSMDSIRAISLKKCLNNMCDFIDASQAANLSEHNFLAVHIRPFMRRSLVGINKKLESVAIEVSKMRYGSTSDLDAMEERKEHELRVGQPVE